jgi:hypothetical protein
MIECVQHMICNILHIVTPFAAWRVFAFGGFQLMILRRDEGQEWLSSL